MSHFIEAIKANAVSDNRTISRELTEADDCFEGIIPNFAGNGYRHQLTSLSAMLYIENNINGVTYEKYFANRQVEATITANSSLLSDPVGSGKSFTVLMFICARPVVSKPFKVTVNFEDSMNVMTSLAKKAMGKIITPKHKIYCNLIYVAESVMAQWAHLLDTVTTLPYCKDPNQILTMIKNKDHEGLNKYVILLIPYNNKYSFEGHDINNFDYVAKSPLIFNRVFIDDFDVLENFPHNSKIKAVHTWYISSTNITGKNDQGIFSDGSMNSFNVRNSIKFIEKSVSVPTINYKLIKCHIHQDALLEMLNNVSNDRELFNGAIGDVVLSREVKTPFELVKKTLGDLYRKYKNALEILKDPIDVETRLKTEKIIDNCTNKLKRIKDNLCEKCCPICYDDFVDGVFINQCCGVILCKNCVINCNLLYVKKIDKVTADLSSKCPKCRSEVSLNGNTITYIDLNVLEKLEGFDATQEEPEEVVVPKQEKEKIIDSKYQDKLFALIDLINDQLDPKCIENVNVGFQHIMTGSKHVPPAGNRRKILIFNSFDKSIGSLTEVLSKHIKTWSLDETTEMNNVFIEQFRNYEDNACLVINSMTHCAGLNLQFTTDLVFTHLISEAGRMSQVIGRSQRINRECSLNVWFVFAENEKTSLFENYPTVAKK